jgi:hypothetical protein
VKQPVQHLEVSVMLRWYDIWVGVYIDHTQRTVYVCLIPCLVIAFRLVRQAD